MLPIPKWAEWAFKMATVNLSLRIMSVERMSGKRIIASSWEAIATLC